MAYHLEVVFLDEARLGCSGLLYYLFFFSSHETSMVELDMSPKVATMWFRVIYRALAITQDRLTHMHVGRQAVQPFLL